MLLTIKEFSEDEGIPNSLFSNPTNLDLNPNTKLTSYIDEESNLVIIDLLKTPARCVSLPKIVSYSWQSDSTSPLELVVVNAENGLQLYSFDLEEFTFQFLQVWTKAHLKRIFVVEEFESMTLMNFNNSEIVMILNSSIALLLQLEESQIVLKSLYTMRTYGLQPIYTNGYLVFLNPDLTYIFVIYLACNYRMAWYDTRTLQIFDIEDVKVTSNVEKIFIYTKDHMIRILTTDIIPTEAIDNSNKPTLIVSPAKLSTIVLPIDAFNTVQMEDWMVFSQSVFCHFIDENDQHILLDIRHTGDNIIIKEMDAPIRAAGNMNDTPIIFSKKELSLFLKEGSKNPFKIEEGVPLDVASKIVQWQDISLEPEIIEIGLKNKQLEIASFFLEIHFQNFKQICESLHSEAGFLTAENKKITKMLSHMFGVVQENIGRSTNEFARNVLILIHSTVSSMIDALATCKHDTNEAEQLHQQLMLYLIQTRQLSFQTISSPDVEPPASNDLFSHYFGLTDDEAIQLALKTGDTLMCSTYLSTIKKLSPEEINKMFTNKVKEHVLLHLEKGEKEKATQMLLHMGISTSEMFINIFKTTFNHSLKDYLYHEIENNLTAHEIEAYSKLKSLETIYFNTSFNSILLNADTNRSTYSVDEKCDEPPFWGVGDLVPSQCFGKSNYSNLTFEWVLEWDDITWEKIFLEAYFSGATKEFPKVSASACWQYLLSHGHHNLIKDWIAAVIGKNSNVNSPFRHLSIDGFLVNTVRDFGPKHIQEMILDDLARYGIFCEDDLEDFNFLLARLGRIQFSLSSGCPTNHKFLTQEDFAHRFVHYCLQNKLMSILYHFTTRSITKGTLPSCPQCSSAKTNIIYAIRNWEKKPYDSETRFKALLATCFYIYKDMKELSISSLYNAAPPEILMAMLLCFPYKDISLFDVKKVEDYLCLKFPMLSSLLNPANAMQTDISVYQLLQNNHLFDPTKLFGWQLTNKIKSEETSSQLPHFSCPSLVQQNSTQEHLTYVYYLLQGRPSMAFYLTIGTNVNKHALPSQIMSIALKNYNSYKVTAACITVLEMWGSDSSTLRIYLNIARLLHQSRNPTDTTNLEEIVSIFENDGDPSSLLKEIYSAIETLQNTIEPEKYFEANIIWWHIIASFCQIHQLDMPTKFMEISAQNDDWLSFLVYAELFSIPLDKTISLLSKFSNQCIVGNIAHALGRVKALQNISPEEAEEGKLKLMRQNSLKLRQSLYDKIGFKNENEQTSSEKDEELSEISLGDEDPFTPRVLNPLTDDLISQILFSSNIDSKTSKSNFNVELLIENSLRMENPILALIGHYFSEEFELILCLETWLKISLKSDRDMKLEPLLKLCMESEKGLLVLQKAFYLFLDETYPLLSLAKYFVNFLIKKSFDVSFNYFKLFISNLLKFDDTPNEENVLADKSWIAKISIDLIKRFLMMPKPIMLQEVLFHHLAYSNITESYNNIEVDCPDFNLLYQLLQPLKELPLPLEMLLETQDHPNYLKGFWIVIDELHKRSMYNEALAIANSIKLPVCEVIFRQLRLMGQTISSVHFDEKNISYWKECTNKFQMYKVQPEQALEFFMERVKVSQNALEKFIIYNHAIEWFLNQTTDLDQVKLNQLLYDRWLSLINALMKNPSSMDQMASIFKKSPQLLRNFKVSLTIDPLHQTVYSLTEYQALTTLIKWLLSNKLQEEAFQVSQLFAFSIPEQETITECLKYAKEEIDVDPKEQLETISYKEFKLTEYQYRVLAKMDQLCLKTIEFQPLFEEIKILTITAMTLRKTYDQILEDLDPYKIIKLVLITTVEHRFLIAKQLASILGIPPQNLSNFIIEETLFALKYSRHDDKTLFQFLKEEFKQISQLGGANDLLASNLMKMSESILQQTQYENDYSLVVELYICAHTCYTHLCALEGISQVLEKAKKLCFTLSKLKLFSQVVRLLVGIGRYLEMSYVFDLLHKNQSLELLFKKGLEKEENLKLALLDYIKQHPELQEDFYPLLPVHFEMFREVAEMSEKTAINGMNRVIEKYMQPVLTGKIQDQEMDTLQINLDNAMADYANAADCFCKAECFQHAQICSRKAELLALQYNLVPKKTWILGLEKDQVYKFLVEHDYFFESLIVLDDYQYQPSWSQVLFHQIVENGNWTYLVHFKSYYKISESLIEEIAKRYEQCEQSPENTTNFKKLIYQCENISIQMQLASTFKFEDIVNELLQQKNSAIVKDCLLKQQRSAKSSDEPQSCDTL